MNSLVKSLVPKLVTSIIKGINEKPPVTGPWLLETGYWNNDGVWDNTAFWINEV